MTSLHKLIVSDKQMFPRHKKGEAVYYIPDQLIDENPTHDCVIRFKDGSMIVRVFVKATKDKVIVRKYHPEQADETISRKSIIRMYPVYR